MMLAPLLLLAACCAGGAQGARILAITPIPARSHMNMISAVTRGLALRGHDVTMFSAWPMKDMPANHKVVVIGNPFEGEVVNNKEVHTAVLLNYDPWEMMSSMVEWGQTLVNATLGHPAFQAEINNPTSKYDLILGEPFLFQECFVAVAHKLNVPFISVYATGTFLYIDEIMGNPINPSWVPNIMLGYSDHMSLYERMVNTMYTLYLYRLFYWIHLPSQQVLASKYFPDAPPLVELLNTRVALTLINSHHTLHYPTPLPPSVVQIGGVHINETRKPLPKELKDFMDNAKNGVVYFSMGSNIKIDYFDNDKKDAILGALSSLKQDVILKWDGPVPNVPPNIHIIEWAPQADLLAHPNMRVFVSHGGLLSTQEAVYHGIPLVGIPMFGDQLFNMKIAVHKGFCVHVNFHTITKESLETALKEVIEKPKYAQAAKRLSALYHSQSVKPIDAAVFWVEHVLQHGGDHLKPASVHLAWYQLLLLDVLLVLLAPLLLLGLGCKALCCRRRAPSTPATTAAKKKKTN